MRLLVITRHPPLPEWDGAGAYLSGLLTHLARQGVTIEIAWSRPPGNWIHQGVVRFPRSMTSIGSLQLPGALAFGPWRWMTWGSWKARNLHRLKSLFRRSGPNALSTPAARGVDDWSRVPTGQELAFFRERIRAFKPDTVLANYCWMLPAIEDARVRTAVLAHDVASHRFAQIHPGALRPDNPLSPANPMGERMLLARAQTILAITEDDAAIFRNWLPHANTVVTPMAIVPAESGVAPIPGRCLFVGGMNEPNREGLAWLLKEIWPDVRQQHPHASLHIYGNISRAVQQPPEGVTVHGPVADLSAAYAESSVALIPLLRGSGMKIKLVQAAGHGLACVTTPVGLQGLAALADHVLTAIDSRQFAAAISRLLADPSYARSLGRSARQHIAENFSPAHCYGPARAALFPSPAPLRAPIAPVVSVVMPVYNGARYLRLAVDSILTQTWRDFELIAVDDGSTDSSKTILESFAAHDPRVVVISRPNTGIVGALNDGIARARGEFIARMDADDEAAPTRLAAQVARLRAEPALVGLGSAVTFMDAAGHSVKSFARPLDHVAIERALLCGDGGAMIHPVVTFRARAVRQVGGYREHANYVEDLDLFLRLAQIGALANLPTSELRYRVHPASINFTKNAGRHAVKLEVVREACAARGLPRTVSPATSIRRNITAIGRLLPSLSDRAASRSPTAGAPCSCVHSIAPAGASSATPSPRRSPARNVSRHELAHRHHLHSQSATGIPDGNPGCVARSNPGCLELESTAGGQRLHRSSNHLAESFVASVRANRP